MGKHHKKREAFPILSLVLLCVLVAAGGLGAAGSRAVMKGGGLEHDPGLGVLCASIRAGGNISCAFSRGGMRLGFSPALTGRSW